MSPERRVPHVEQQDLDSLSLDLQGSPVQDRLAVFIQDPADPQVYRYRKVSVGRKKQAMRGVDYVDIGVYDMGELDQKPVPAEHLAHVVAIIWREEIALGSDSDPSTRSMVAAVGIAEYRGRRRYTIDELATLAGVKYAQMRVHAGN